MLSQLLFRPSVTVAVLFASALLTSTAGIAQSPRPQTASAPASGSRYAAQQIRVPHASAPARKQKSLVSADAAAVPTPTRAPSLVRQAAHGHIIHEHPPQQLAGSAVRPVSHDCSCDQCSAMPLHTELHCGVEEAHCGLEPIGTFAGGCGIEGCYEPGCGFGAALGIEEAACGVEPAGCGGYGCDVGCCNDCLDIRLPIFRIDWRRFEFFAGVNSFTGPANHATDAVARRGGSGSFGFYEGFNEGRSLNRLFGLDLASQLGMRATQSSLSGAEFTDEARKQIFVTGGLFRRVDFGLQYGLVVDYLYDDWWFRNDLVQLRGELSWNDACGHEFGYQFMAGTKDSTSTTHLLGAGDVLVNGTATFEATDQHRLFLRGNTAGGGSYMAFAGGTDRGDGLLGGSLISAFRKSFAVQGGATYLIPTESSRAGGYENEAWNLSMGIVYRPGGKAGCGRYCRPLFDVADNGSFLVDRR